MTRRVGFSSGHRYWIPSLSESENRDLFGIWASPYNHGHNYILDVTVEGRVDPQTGMVVNIKWIDDILKAHIVKQFDGKSINDEVPFFHSHSSCLENIAAYIADSLRAPGILPKEVQLTSLRLEEMPTLYVDLDLQPPIKSMTLTRSYEFAASHRLDSPHLSPEENLRLFGKCNNPAGHGHNYILEVTVSGEPAEKTGMLVDLELLDRVVNELVVDRYDHKNLNVDLPEFEGRTTTSEIVVLEIFERLQNHLPAKLHSVKLYETARNAFQVIA